MNPTYWLFKQKCLQGPFNVTELLAQEGFSETTLVCEVGQDDWRPARTFQAIRSRLAPAAVMQAEVPPAAEPPPAVSALQAVNQTRARVLQSGDYSALSPKQPKAKTAANIAPAAPRPSLAPSSAVPYKTLLFIGLFLLSGALGAAGLYKGWAAWGAWWSSRYPATLAPRPQAHRRAFAKKSPIVVAQAEPKFIVYNSPLTARLEPPSPPPIKRRHPGSGRQRR